MTPPTRGSDGTNRPSRREGSVALKGAQQGAFVVTVLVLSVLAVAAQTALARPATTAPGARVYVKLLITKRSLVIGNGSSAPRGEWVVFRVVNSTKGMATVSFLGQTSRRIPPTHVDSFAVFVLRRGAFPLVASLPPGRRLRQTFIVY